MRVVVTGAAGFLGWHTRLRLRARTTHDVVAVDRAAWPRLPELLTDADAVLHLAGVNRGTDAQVADGNVALAQDLAAALPAARRGVRVVLAGSVQAGNGTPYGTGKAAATALLQQATARTGGTLVDVVLPNLFGEHGRPGYNSFVATFADAVAHGRTPTVQDRPVALLHAQDAAAALLDALTGPPRTEHPPGTPTTVATVLTTLQQDHALYRTGDLPPLDDPLRRALFHTLRAAALPAGLSVPLHPRTDARGRLVETVRSHGGPGQTFVSTTAPGVTRGRHFHLRKLERFVVLDGQARIRLRRVLHDDVVTLHVDGTTPVAVDMPTGWAHDLTNTGTRDLTTLFWTSELFDPDDPDTTPEPVEVPTLEEAR